MAENKKHECELSFEFGSAKDAELVAKALDLDNPDFIKTEIDGRVIRSRITADSINSLINTLDDYLACIAMAEKIVKDKR